MITGAKNMSKKKRTYNTDVVLPSSLRLHPVGKSSEKGSDQSNQVEAKRELFSVELINRLTERIKKL